MSYEEMIRNSAKKISWQVAVDIQESLYQMVQNGDLPFTQEAVINKAEELIGGFEPSVMLDIYIPAYYENLKRRLSQPEMVANL